MLNFMIHIGYRYLVILFKLINLPMDKSLIGYIESNKYRYKILKINYLQYSR